MSFPQQSRSDLAAAEADARRKQLNESTSTSPHRIGASSANSSGVVARLLGWFRRLFAR